jgi:DNA-binding FadR family transcriptional regulator
VETGGNVSFEIQTPMDAVTKAIGNGENVDIVHYEIYKAIEHGDAVLASQLTARHIANARKHMFGA